MLRNKYSIEISKCYITCHGKKMLPFFTYNLTKAEILSRIRTNYKNIFLRKVRVHPLPKTVSYKGLPTN